MDTKTEAGKLRSNGLVTTKYPNNISITVDTDMVDARDSIPQTKDANVFPENDVSLVGDRNFTDGSVVAENLRKQRDASPGAEGNHSRKNETSFQSGTYDPGVHVCVCVGRGW